MIRSQKVASDILQPQYLGPHLNTARNLGAKENACVAVTCEYLHAPVSAILHTAIVTSWWMIVALPSASAADTEVGTH